MILRGKTTKPRIIITPFTKEKIKQIYEYYLIKNNIHERPRWI
jgi:hypothetical protein